MKTLQPEAPPPLPLAPRPVERRSRPRGLRPVDWFTMVYLALTLVLLFVYPHRASQSWMLAGAHAAGILVLIAARRLQLERFRFFEFLLAFYPLLLFALFYTEVGILCRMVFPGVFFDPMVLRWEEALFSGQPSQDLYRRLGSPALGEFLHLGYVSYYFLVPVLLGTLWFTRPRRDFEQALGTISLAFYTCFILFILIPVAGPYYIFEPPPAGGVGIHLSELTRFVLNRGSSVGAAFPSSHVAVAVTVWIMALRYSPALAIIFALLVPALAVGAVYGGYHYAVDAVAGVVLGLVTGTLGHSLTVRVWNRLRMRVPS